MRLEMVYFLLWLGRISHYNNLNLEDNLAQSLKALRTNLVDIFQLTFSFTYKLDIFFCSYLQNPNHSINTLSVSRIVQMYEDFTDCRKDASISIREKCSTSCPAFIGPLIRLSYIISL